MRRSFVKLITFVGGLYFLLEFLLPAKAPPWLGGFANPLTQYLGAVTTFAIVVGTMAFLLGPFNLVRTHLKALLARKKGWLEGAVFLLFFTAAIAAKAFRGTGAIVGVMHDAFFYGVMTAFFASSMALLAFYLVSAAHRAFRLNNTEAALMMVSAAIVLLGQVPLGDWLTHALPDWLQLRSWALWILQTPNTAVQRAVVIGACGGAFAAAVRHWLGLGTRTE